MFGAPKVVAPAYVNEGPRRFDPVTTSIDYVLVHTRFLGSRKLSSFDGRRVGRYLTSLHGCSTLSDRVDSLPSSCA
jgi:hypothetical protein